MVLGARLRDTSKATSKATMKLAQTMSKTGLLLQCPWPFDPNRELPDDISGEPADYGVAFHAIMAVVCSSRFVIGPEKKDVKELAHRYNLFAPELWAHYIDSSGFLHSWLIGDNPWGVDFLAHNMPRTEIARAFSPVTYESRPIEGPDASHIYHDIRPGEIVGTADMVVETPDTILVDDHKTGAGDFSRPSENPQILSLACAFAMKSRKKVIGAISHFPRGGLPQVFAEEITREAMALHAAKLDSAMARVGDGSLRTGPYCKYCPARNVCPTRDVNLIEAITVAGGLVKQSSSSVVTAEKIGQLHELLTQVEYHTIPKARDAIRRWVKDHPSEVATRPDGKVLAFVQRSFERLSKSSVVKALGKVAGEKELARLRKLKCLTEDTREELHAVDNE
jgi:hypothetical protein